MRDSLKWPITAILLFVLLLRSGDNPTPPGPGPGPGPDPKPAVVSPINEPGLHVLIVEESSMRTPMTATVVNSAAWGQLVDADRARVFDQHTPMDYEAQKWKDAMARPRASIPWLIVSNAPKGGFEGPLPSDPAALAAIIQQWKDAK